MESTEVLPPLTLTCCSRISRSTAGCSWWPPQRSGRCWEQIRSWRPPSRPGSWCPRCAPAQRCPSSDPQTPGGGITSRLSNRDYVLFWSLILKITAKMSIYAAYSILGLCIFKSKRTNIFMRSFALNISNCCHLFHHHCLLLIKVPLFVLDTLHADGRERQSSSCSCSYLYHPYYCCKAEPFL